MIAIYEVSDLVEITYQDLDGHTKSACREIIGRGESKEDARLAFNNELESRKKTWAIRDYKVRSIDRSCVRKLVEPDSFEYHFMQSSKIVRR